MTPAINAAKKAKITYVVHEYAHDPAEESYGLEAASKLGIPEEKVFKTLVVSFGPRDLAVGIIPVSAMLSMKLMAKALGSKKVSMADGSEVERTTGYVLGGVSPIGQKKQLKTIIDSSAFGFQTVFVSGGRRGLEIELKPEDLLSLTNGDMVDICQ